jgi:hypothetical protein
MSKRLSFEPESATIEHPAIRAWGNLGTSARMPSSVAVLKTYKGKSPSRKSSVFRLEGVGHDGTAIIAKRARRPTMHVERVVYEEILPSVPVTAVRCYGFVEERDSEYCWLFLEEVIGEDYSESSPKHRSLAAEWLSVLHTFTANLALSAIIPELRLDRYRACLQTARETMVASLSSDAISREGGTVLQTLIRDLDAIEAKWPSLERFCAAMPRCLVHGDFIEKNVRVRSNHKRSALYVMDWEAAAWGVPAEDLAGLDLKLYGPRVQPVWPQLDVEALGRLAAVGTVFKCLSFVQAFSRGLASKWVEYAIEDLKPYTSQLTEAARLARELS